MVSHFLDKTKNTVKSLRQVIIPEGTCYHRKLEKMTGLQQKWFRTTVHIQFNRCFFTFKAGKE